MQSCVLVVSKLAFYSDDPDLNHFTPSLPHSLPHPSHTPNHNPWIYRAYFIQIPPPLVDPAFPRMIQMRF